MIVKFIQTLGDSTNWLTTASAIAGVISAICTGIAAYYAARSAKMSEKANRAQFSPFIVPTRIFYSSQSKIFEISFRNKTQYQNAYAKNVYIEKSGSRAWEDDTIGPDNPEYAPSSARFDNIEANDEFFSEIKIIYEDILKNKFETKIIPIRIEDKSTLDFKWEYIQN
jgi:hypothetical protein